MDTNCFTSTETSCLLPLNSALLFSAGVSQVIGLKIDTSPQWGRRDPWGNALLFPCSVWLDYFYHTSPRISFLFSLLSHSFKSLTLYFTHSFNLCVSFSLMRINSSMNGRGLFFNVLQILHDSECFTSTFVQLSFEINMGKFKKHTLFSTLSLVLLYEPNIFHIFPNLSPFTVAKR